MRKLSLFRRALTAALAATAMLGSVASAVAAEDQGARPNFITGEDGVQIPGPDSPIERPPATVNGLTYMGTALIRSVYSPDGLPYCLDAHEGGRGDNNSPVLIWPCDGARTTQRWNLYRAGSSTDADIRIINYRWNRSLDYPASSNGANGRPYGIYDLVHSPGQRFYRDYYSGPRNYSISNLLGGSFNVITGNVSWSGIPVHNAENVHDLRQRWVFHHI